MNGPERKTIAAWHAGKHEVIVRCRGLHRHAYVDVKWDRQRKVTWAQFQGYLYLGHMVEGPELLELLLGLHAQHMRTSRLPGRKRRYTVYVSPEDWTKVADYHGALEAWLILADDRPLKAKKEVRNDH